MYTTLYNCDRFESFLAKAVWYDHNCTMMAEPHQGNGCLYFLVIYDIDDEWDRMWYNSIQVYLYLEVINSSFFWAPSNQCLASNLKKGYFCSFGADILVAHNALM